MMMKIMKRRSATNRAKSHQGKDTFEKGTTEKARASRHAGTNLCESYSNPHAYARHALDANSDDVSLASLVHSVSLADEDAVKDIDDMN